MTRHLHSLLLVLLFLLSVAGAVLWVTSYRGVSRVQFSHKDMQWEIVSADGELRLSNEPQRRAESQQWAREHRTMVDELLRLGNQLSREAWQGDPATQPSRATFDELGARIISHQIAPPRTRRDINFTMSYYLVVLAAAALPSWWAASHLRRWWRTRQERLIGLCSICGYDLRATPDRCPECGATPNRDASPPPTPGPERSEGPDVLLDVFL